MRANFQIIVVVVFVALAGFGLMVFSGLIKIGGDSKTSASGTVVLWGTIKNEAIAPILETFNQVNQTFVVKYVQKYPETFDQDLLEALASGVGPDMFFLPDNLVLKYSNKIYAIPYASYPLASFKNVFAGAGEVFLTSKGILALPMAIDPLVMYYNRSMLDANNIIYPPTTWSDFVSLVPTLTKKDEGNKIIKSGAALGQFTNVTHAKDIISTLFMQGGNSIVAEKSGAFYSTLADSLTSNLGSILKFYTDFTDPTKNVYSWNRSFPSSTDAFSSSDLAFYFGFASELSSLINKNPNQNFLASPFPQIKNASFKLTGAHVLGLVISAFSKNPSTALTAAGLMSNGDFASKLTNALFVPPARRDLLGAKLTDSFFPVFYNSALYAKSWLDPSPKDSDDIFRSMIDKVLSNSFSPDDAVKDASSKLGLLLIK